jgi:glycosyltransferase involved in cell wall biosynthesis
MEKTVRRFGHYFTAVRKKLGIRHRLRILIRKSSKLSALLIWLEDFQATGRLIALANGSPITNVRREHRRAATMAWSTASNCPRALYDAAGAKVGNALYIVKGYRRLGVINNKIFVFDLLRGRWMKAIDAPARLAHSHQAVCSDGARFIYVASGQLGPQCHPAIADCFSFDTKLRTWRKLPDLPEPRYAGTMQLLSGRLHFVGGALLDRYKPACDHWSLGVIGADPVEDSWRKEPPIPLAAMHRGSAVVGDTIYVFGGQQGDFVAIPGDPNFTCRGDTPENYLGDTYRYTPTTGEWKRVSEMLVPVSHTDFSVVPIGKTVHVIGGQIYKNYQHFRLRLTDLIQTYDVDSDSWSISGYLPYRLKSPICASHNGTITCSTGQRDQGSINDAPGSITSDTWQIALKALERSTHKNANKLQMVKGKDVVLISHNLSLTGAPLALIETAEEMQQSGANVRLFTLADDANYGHIGERYRIPILPVETAASWARRADLVIANTCVAGPWIREYLAKFPYAGRRLVWWCHENPTEEFEHYINGTEAVALMLFDSYASQAAWEASGIHLPANRATVHLANRDEIFEAALTARLPWPLSAKGERVTRAVARERMGINGDEFLLLCIGTVVPRKGQALLIRTVGRLLCRDPDLPLRLLLVGFSEEARRATLLGLSEKERKAVLDGKLLWTEQDELDVFYRSADCFVMNSQERGEAFGRVTIEAMAFGLPVLGTNAGGTSEIVVDGTTGLLHPVGEDGLELLATNLLSLVNDRSRAKHLGIAGQIRAREYFSSPRFCSDFEEALRPVLSGDFDRWDTNSIRRGPLQGLARRVSR